VKLYRASSFTAYKAWPMAQVTRTHDAVSQVRMTLDERHALDDWRRRQLDIPTRPEAIREAIRRLVGHKATAGGDAPAT
jgi:hypothetical protein